MTDTFRPDQGRILLQSLEVEHGRFNLDSLTKWFACMILQVLVGVVSDVRPKEAARSALGTRSGFCFPKGNYPYLVVSPFNACSVDGSVHLFVSSTIGIFMPRFPKAGEKTCISVIYHVTVKNTEAILNRYHGNTFNAIVLTTREV